MIVGAVAFVLSLIAWSTWGGIGTFRRERRVVRRTPGVDGVTDHAVGYEEEEIRHVS